MTTAALLLGDYDREIGNTRRTLERVDEDKRDWRPHPRSMPMGRLAMHCATLPLFGLYILEDDGLDMGNSARPHASLDFTSRAECLHRLDESAAACRAALEGASEEKLAVIWHFRYGSTTISNDSRAVTLRVLCFNHLVHHTAQLGVYLRLNDLPVPALYGPSADEQWSPGR